MPRICFAVCLLLAAPLVLAQDTPLTQPNPAVAKWEQLLPAIKAALPPQNNCAPNPTIDDAADFPGKLPVALIKICKKDPHADRIAVMQIENGQPVLARFRDQRRSAVVPDLELRDSSETKQKIQLVPRSGAILTTMQKTDKHNQDLGCSAAVYTWNPRTRTFDWNAKQTRKALGNYCAD